jgi:SAM-dependent methyltransferase
MIGSRKEDRYYQGDRADLLQWLGGHHSRVLEVGCGSGGNAAWLRRHGATRIVGIETDAASAARARDVFDEVIVESVETALDDLHESFDLIVCADVLEHLVDPWAVTAKLAEKTVEGGLLIVSVPNIRHYRALWRIAFGVGFRYEEEGTFDSTHLRFFDRAGLERMLIQGGWVPQRWGGSGGRRLKLLRFAIRLGRPWEYGVYQWHVVARLAAATISVNETVRRPSNMPASAPGPAHRRRTVDGKSPEEFPHAILRDDGSAGA